MNEYDYIVDAFTKDGDNTNLEVDNLNVGCVTSKNNKFSLDSEGNLIVKSITTESGAGLDFNAIYPVGSIYMSVAATSPSVLFGGTWEQIKDCFLLACGDTYQNGNQGGEATHTLTEEEMPTHTHVIGSSGGHNHNQYFFEFRWPTSNYYGTKLVGRPVSTGAQNTNEKMNTTNGAHTHTPGNAGGDGAHNNMPPYLAVYVWKRTA